MEELDIAFKKIAKGTGFIFIGFILGALLGLVFRVIIVRIITPAEFGLFSLTLVIINLLATISSLGFENSVPRYISCALAQKAYSTVWNTINFSIKIILLLSTIFSFILFFLASNAANLFHKPSLIVPIRILVFLTPVLALTNLLIAILRGFENVKAKVYFQNTLPWALKIILLCVVIILGLSFKGVLYTYLISLFLTLAFLIFYTRNSIIHISSVPSGSEIFNIREFLFFSFPLLGVGISSLIMGWTDTFMLGYFKSADIVGLYNIALPLSRFMPVPIHAMGFIYLPVVSQLYSQNNFKDMKKLYASVTKWTFFITLPVFLCMLFAPKAILNLLFGVKYIDASIALQLLVIGEFFHTFFGPNGMTMISLGRTNIILFCTLISALSNIILNLLLIPKYGLAGAAIASAFSLGLQNITLSSFMFKYYAIHPFNKNYFKPIVFTFIFCLILFKWNYLAKNLNILFLVIIAFLLSFISIFFTKSIDQEDIKLLEALEIKLRNKNDLTKKLAVWCGLVNLQ